MHDIDRTQFEADEFEGAYGGEFEQSELELPLHETQELELASSLLEVSTEMELEQFLGDVFRAVGRAAGQFARSDTGRALGGILKNTINQALPVIGGALGGASGGATAQQAGSLLGLELEGLSPQDQEFETARQIVRFASNAYRNAAWAPRNVPPASAARNAVLSAARRYAPGLLRALGTSRWGSYRSGWQGGRYGLGSQYRYGSTYGYRPQYGYGGYGGYGGSYRSTPWYGSGWRYAYGQPSYGGGYSQPGQWYWRRRRHRRPWEQWGYGGYQPTEPDAGAFVQAAPEPPPPPPPIAVPEPPPAPPPAAEPSPPSAGSSELEFFPGANGWHPDRGVGGPAARNGRWVRRGGVLVVYGA